jgi:chloramphenicol 3-O phosphotransferase
MIINGGSSSGKTGIVRCLQAVLEEPWLAFGIDDFVEAMPAAMEGSAGGLEIGPDGEVSAGPAFRELEAAWMAGIIAMCRAGARVIIDDVFLSGAGSQQRWRDVIGDVETLWVGVHCPPEVVTGRELARGDRVPGMAAKQAFIVHEGVTYDVEVDSANAESIDCARIIAAHLK